MIHYLTKIFNWLTKSYGYQDSLDSYLVTKNPKSAAEVDYWIRQYDFNKKGWL
jgi:hypothetical protein